MNGIGFGSSIGHGRVEATSRPGSGPRFERRFFHISSATVSTGGLAPQKIRRALVRFDRPFRPRGVLYDVLYPGNPAAARSCGNAQLSASTHCASIRTGADHSSDFVRSYSADTARGLGLRACLTFLRRRAGWLEKAPYSMRQLQTKLLPPPPHRKSGAGRAAKLKSSPRLTIPTQSRPLKSNAIPSRSCCSCARRNSSPARRFF